MLALWTAWDFVRDYWPWAAGVSLAILAMLAWAYFTGSIKVAIEALGAVAVALSAAAVYRRGAASEKARNDAEADRALERTKAAQAEVNRMSDERVQAELDRWITPETKP